MATSTTRLGLTKPDGTDLVDIAVLNTNANKIDAAAGAFVCTSTTRPATPYSGQIIYETDTDGSLIWDSATSAWNVLTPGATVCTSASRPASPVPGQVIYETDTKLTYVYASGTWAPVVNNKAVSAFAPIRVADGTARDALFTSPVQGDSVLRVDKGWTETYFALYNVTTNPGGATPAGWYPTSGHMPFAFLSKSGATQSVGTGLTAITFQSDVSKDGLWVSGSNTRITPNFAGWWQVSYKIQGSITTGNYFQSEIGVTGVRNAQSATLVGANSNNRAVNVNSLRLKCTTVGTDYFILSCSGQIASSIATGGDLEGCFFSAQYIGPAK